MVQHMGGEARSETRTAAGRERWPSALREHGAPLAYPGHLKAPASPAQPEHSLSIWEARRGPRGPRSPGRAKER